jgi:hypothetical protein
VLGGWGGGGGGGAGLRMISRKKESFFNTWLTDFPTFFLSILQVQTSCKPYYVQRGLMLGEFHLRNNSPGLRNESFFPLRTPVPCLAVRHMVSTNYMMYIYFLRFRGI